METTTTTTTNHTDNCRGCGTEVTWTDEADRPTDAAGLIACNDCYDDTTGYIR